MIINPILSFKNFYELLLPGSIPSSATVIKSYTWETVCSLVFFYAF